MDQISLNFSLLGKINTNSMVSILATFGLKLVLINCPLTHVKIFHIHKNNPILKLVNMW